MAAAQGFLSKSDVFPGAILWLGPNAHILDNVTYGRSDLTQEALDHPVLVVATLRDGHSFLWICTASYL